MTKEELHLQIEESTGNESNVCQVCAIKNGEVVYEDHWSGFECDTPVNVNSVTKGIMALLTGIAFDRGLIESTEQKVLDFFPDYTVKRGEKTIYDVKLKHLLTMIAPYKYRSEPWKKVCTSSDWTKAAKMPPVRLVEQRAEEIALIVADMLGLLHRFDRPLNAAAVNL